MPEWTKGAALKAVEGACSPSGGSNPSPSVNLSFITLKDTKCSTSLNENQRKFKAT